MSSGPVAPSSRSPAVYISTSLLAGTTAFLVTAIATKALKGEYLKYWDIGIASASLSSAAVFGLLWAVYPPRRSPSGADSGMAGARSSSGSKSTNGSSDGSDDQAESSETTMYSAFSSSSSLEVSSDADDQSGIVPWSGSDSDSSSEETGSWYGRRQSRYTDTRKGEESDSSVEGEWPWYQKEQRRKTEESDTSSEREEPWFRAGQPRHTDTSEAEKSDTSSEREEFTIKGKRRDPRGNISGPGARDVRQDLSPKTSSSNKRVSSEERDRIKNRFINKIETQGCLTETERRTFMKHGGTESEIIDAMKRHSVHKSHGSSETDRVAKKPLKSLAGLGSVKLESKPFRETLLLPTMWRCLDDPTDPNVYTGGFRELAVMALILDQGPKVLGAASENALEGEEKTAGYGTILKARGKAAKRPERIKLFYEVTANMENTKNRDAKKLIDQLMTPLKIKDNWSETSTFFERHGERAKKICAEVYALLPYERFTGLLRKLFDARDTETMGAATDEFMGTLARLIVAHLMAGDSIPTHNHLRDRILKNIKVTGEPDLEDIVKGLFEEEPGDLAGTISERANALLEDPEFYLATRCLAEGLATQYGEAVS